LVGGGKKDQAKKICVVGRCEIQKKEKGNRVHTNSNVKKKRENDSLSTETTEVTAVSSWKWCERKAWKKGGPKKCLREKNKKQRFKVMEEKESEGGCGCEQKKKGLKGRTSRTKICTECRQGKSEKRAASPRIVTRMGSTQRWIERGSQDQRGACRKGRIKRA